MVATVRDVYFLNFIHYTQLQMNITIGSSNGLDAVEESFLVKFFEILQNVPIFISQFAIGVAVSLLVGRWTVEQTVDKVARI